MGRRVRQRTIVPKRPIRRPQGSLLCAPLRADETFGSWFCATARLHGCSRRMLAEALLAERGGSMPVATLDWDLGPPLELLEALEGRLSRTIIRQLRLRIPARHPDLLRIHDRWVICPVCLQEEGESGAPWARCAHLWAWTVLCPTHRCPLMGIPRPVRGLSERIPPEVLQEDIVPPDRLNLGLLEQPPVIQFSPRSLRWLWDVQRLFRPRPSHQDGVQKRLGGCSELDERLAQRIVRDLVMATACDIQGMTLLQWTLPDWRRWVWQRADCTSPEHCVAWSPLGDLRLRQEAIRLAGQIWHWLHGDLSFEHSNDQQIYVGMRQIRATSGYGRFFGELVSAWPSGFRTKWRQAFGETWRRADRTARSAHSGCVREVTRPHRHALWTRLRYRTRGSRQIPLKPCSMVLHPPRSTDR